MPCYLLTIYRPRGYPGKTGGQMSAVSVVVGRGSDSQRSGVPSCIADQRSVTVARARGGKAGGLDLRLSRVRARLEMAMALCAGVLGILTIFWHDWIEALTGWDPDHNSSSAEWIVVVGPVAVAITMGLVARRHWMLLTAVPGQIAATGGQSTEARQ